MNIKREFGSGCPRFCRNLLEAARVLDFDDLSGRHGTASPSFRQFRSIIPRGVCLAGDGANCSGVEGVFSVGAAQRGGTKTFAGVFIKSLPFRSTKIELFGQLFGPRVVTTRPLASAGSR